MNSINNSSKQINISSYEDRNFYHLYSDGSKESDNRLTPIPKRIPIVIGLLFLFGIFLIIRGY